MTIFKLTPISVLFSCLLSVSVSAEPLPGSVSGVTFEEWASANGRIANQQNPKEVLSILGVNEATFEVINTTYIEALRTSSTNGDIMRVYSEAFGNPNRGRFASQSKVGIAGKLATFDDYARLQGHMEAATEAGIAPQQVLDEHNLTPYEYSQETGVWVRRLATEAKEKGSDATSYWHEGIAAYKAEYLKKYGR